MGNPKETDIDNKMDLSFCHPFVTTTTIDNRMIASNKHTEAVMCSHMYVFIFTQVCILHVRAN